MNNVTVPPRIGLITLACRDPERMARIFRALGWPEAPSSGGHHTVFQTGAGRGRLGRGLQLARPRGQYLGRRLGRGIDVR